MGDMVSLARGDDYAAAGAKMPESGRFEIADGF